MQACSLTVTVVETILPWQAWWSSCALPVFFRWRRCVSRFTSAKAEPAWFWDVGQQQWIAGTICPDPGELAAGCPSPLGSPYPDAWCASHVDPYIEVDGYIDAWCGPHVVTYTEVNMDYGYDDAYDVHDPHTHQGPHMW